MSLTLRCCSASSFDATCEPVVSRWSSPNPPQSPLQRIADAAGVSLILILSDINMPGMNGLELLPKAKELRPDVPIIMITAYGDADTKRKAFDGGADRFCDPAQRN
jgi:CheY-like chemotaxis protein